MTSAQQASDEAATYYSAFGLLIRSEFTFPDMVCVPPGPADIHINRKKVDHNFKDIEFDYVIDEDRQLFRWQTLGSYCVTGGHTIDMQPNPGVANEHSAIPLFGTVMATLLHMRGLVVLHASAVCHADQCAIFVGNKGAGKSTTAAAMIAAGHNLLSDDVVAIDIPATGAPRVLPAFNQIKLMEDAAARFKPGQGPSQSIHPLIVDKRRHKADNAFHAKPAKPRAIFVLERGEVAEIVPFDATEALTHLIGYSYLSRFGQDAFAPEIAIGHLQRCSRLVEATTVARLIVPNSLDRLADAVELVAGTLGADR